MNKGVEMLLDRMDSNPEEFLPSDIIGFHSYPKKWRHIISAWSAWREGVDDRGGASLTQLHYLSAEDLDALNTKLNTMHADLFTKHVMATLLDAPHDSSRMYSAKNESLT